MNLEKLTQVLQQADFDTAGKSQQRVLSSLKTPNPFQRRFWLVGAATCLLICLWVGWKGPLHDKIFPVKAPSAQQCANLNARYLLEQMAAEEQIILAKCPVSSNNKQVLEELKQQMRQNYHKLTEKERKQLKDCGESFKADIEAAISYVVHC